MSPPAQHNQRWTIHRQRKLSVETSGVVKIYTAEKLTLGSLPHVLKERALNSQILHAKLMCQLAREKNISHLST